MDASTQDANRDGSGDFGPTWKTLFLGACLLISGAFGWWFTHFISTIDRVHERFDKTHDAIGTRLTDLEGRARDETWERKALQREIEELKRKVNK